MEKKVFLLPFSSVILLLHYWVTCLTLVVSLTNLADGYALLALKAHITYDSQGILATNWSSTTSYCNWFGVSCNAHHGRLTSLNLSNMGLEGTIPPQVSNLSFLASLDLSDNYFHASLPNEIGKVLTEKLLSKSTAQ